MINIGGGLGIINRESNIPAPTVESLVEQVAPVIHGTEFTVVVEPGRSIVGDTGWFPYYFCSLVLLQSN